MSNTNYSTPQQIDPTKLSEDKKKGDLDALLKSAAQLKERQGIQSEKTQNGTEAKAKTNGTVDNPFRDSE